MSVQTKKEKVSLTEGNITLALLAFVLPIMAGSLIQQLYTTVDAVIVGQYLGKNGLASIKSVETLFKFPLNFLAGLSGGMTILISKFYGSKDKKVLGESVRTAISTSVLLGAIASVLGFAITPWLLKIMNVPADIYDLTLLYTRIYFAGIWTTTLYNNAAGILRAYGDSKSPMTILIFTGIVNVVGDFVLVGIFKIGVAGAAIATIAAQAISALMAVKKISDLSKALESSDAETLDDMKQTKKGGAFIYPEIKFAYVKSMIIVGFPLAFKSTLFPVANSMIQAVANKQGTDVIAAWGVVSTLDLLIWLIADSTGGALSTLVAQNIGAGKKKRAYVGSMIGTGLTVGSLIFVSMILRFAGGFLSTFLISAQDAPQVIPIVEHMLSIYTIFFFFYGIYSGFSGACCGTGKTLAPMMVTMLGTCGLRVVAVLFIYPLFPGLDCILWIYVASWIASGLGAAYLFFTRFKGWGKCEV